MIFDFTDGWLLYSIYSSEKPQFGAELKDVIAYADYTNHAIMNYSEFTTSLTKLLKIGIVSQIDKNLISSDSFKDWFRKKYSSKKRIYVLKAIENVVKYLNDSFGTYQAIDEINLINLTQQDYSDGVEKYMERGKIAISRIIK